MHHGKRNECTTGPESLHHDLRNACTTGAAYARSEGKHYYVYMVAGGAKFLRIYYARVKEALDAQDAADAAVA